MTFIAWDGEQVTGSEDYCLFGASIDGRKPTAKTYICHPNLRTQELLELLLSVAAANPGASHVAYSFDYDVNWILRELSWPQLITLKVKGRCTWNGYTIEHIPGKIFKVEQGNRRIRVDDVFSYFRSRYDKALRKYGVASEETRNFITSGKDSRQEFQFSDIARITEYWSLELQTMCELMDIVKSMADRVGFTGLKQWHGPGALAAYSLREHDTETYMAKSPPVVLAKALSAYAGGWFERFRFGYHDGWCSTADLNAAYVWAMSLLPDLATGYWEYRTTGLEQAARNCRFGMFRCRWQADTQGYMRACHGIPFPLFHRDGDGSVRRPLATDVWLWNPEAANCTATPYARLTEGWIFHDDGSYPFSWVADMYASRLAMQRAGDPAEKILKWATASYYGRVAQRTGWNERTRTPPRFHQIEWAGWITSLCRATIYRAALDVAMRGGLVSIDTDGIISTVPFSLPASAIGPELGQWKVEEYDGMVYIQNGVYWLHCPGCEAEKHSEPAWHDAKLRGIPHTRFSASDAIQGLRTGGKIDLSRHSFRGYRGALNGRRDEWLQWVDEPVSVSALTAGARVHAERSCSACQSGLGLDEALHELALVPNRQLRSKPHALPWLSGIDSDARLAALLAREVIEYN